MQTPILEVKGLKKYFDVRGGLNGKIIGQVKAVDDLSFSLFPGETFGLVGESGCGKSTAGRTILRLMEPTAGRIFFEGEDLAALGSAALRRKRRDFQMIFQDPYASLNPRMCVFDLVGEALAAHGMKDANEIRQRVRETLELCGLPLEYGSRYPHEFSGGQRQRIGIARALALRPKLIIADEPVSALDVSIQAQILNLLQELQQQLGLTYLFISHDLSVVRHISDRVGVMYLGRLLEYAPAEELYKHPLHPYTQALLSAIPAANPKRKRERIVLQGDVPSPANPPAGCAFAPRCSKAMERCRLERPALQTVSSERHLAACYLWE